MYINRVIIFRLESVADIVLKSHLCSEGSGVNQTVKKKLCNEGKNELNKTTGLQKDVKNIKIKEKVRGRTEEKKAYKTLVEKSSKGQNYCIICNTQYSEKAEFETHARSHKKVPCMICNKLCSTELRLLSHIRNVHSDRPKKISCDLCSKMFATSNSLWVHKKTLHKNKWDFMCSKCGYGTNSKEIFDEHLQKAGDNHSTFKCDACDKSYASQQNLDKHSQLYHVTHRCKSCNKEYGSRNNLLRHIQRSHGKQKVRNIPCEQCAKMFYTKWQLKVHMNFHINKKHECSHCDYSTVYPQALKTHLKIHSKQYSCMCDLCGKGFMNKCALKNHMGREHFGVVVTCSVCQKKFHAQKYLDLHMECHQPGYEMRNHQCEICGRRFLRRPMLRRHIRDHKGLTRTYRCSYCDKVLTSSSSLKDHINIHTGQKPYVCELCGNGFARKNYLTAHLRTHTKEKPFCCEECGSAFSQRGTLTMHLKKHRDN